MQVVNEELKYQQAVLKFLGFYKGKVDGIWSADSIAAKQQFEFTREFAPGIPNNGLPFGTSDRLPKGMHFQRKGNIVAAGHTKITDEEMKVLLGVVEQTVAVRDPIVSNDGPIIAAPVQETAPAETASVAASVPGAGFDDEEDLDDHTEKPEEKPATQEPVRQSQNNQQQRPQHPHKPHQGQRR